MSKNAGPLGARKCAPSTEEEVRQQELKALYERLRTVKKERHLLRKGCYMEQPKANNAEVAEAYRVCPKWSEAFRRSIEAEIGEIEQLIRGAGGEIPFY